MNDYERMLNEYVMPFIALTLVGCAIAFVAQIPIGRAIDKEIAFDNYIYDQYKEVK